MGSTFHSADGPPQSGRVDNEHIASHIKQLEDRESEMVLWLVTLKERHAFFPGEVTARQVQELQAKLEGLRHDLDLARSVLPSHRDWDAPL